MNKDVLRQLLTVLAVLATTAINILSNALPINGLNTGQISDQFQVYFTPAGYVFSIWSLIYLGLIAFAVFQALPSQRDDASLRAIAPLFWLSSAANIAWIFLWHYQVFGLTLVAMFTLLISLILIYLRLGITRGSARGTRKWLVNVPFSLYLGWITVATIANVTLVLWWAGWNGFGIGSEVWLAIVLAAAVIIAALVAVTRADVTYQLVLVWAFAGIAVKHSAVPNVAISAMVAAALAGLLAILSIVPKGPLPLWSH